jgi:hypothetical protein
VAQLAQQITYSDVLLGIGLFAATFFGSLAVVAFLLVRVSPMFFQDSHSRDLWPDRHPVLRLVGLVVKNAVGIALLALGLLLSLPGVPGQGLLTMLIGLMLVDFPGKRRLERRIIGRPRILRAVNRLRRRFGRPPLVLGTRRGQVAARQA